MNRKLRSLAPVLLLAPACLTLRAEQFDRFVGLVQGKDKKPIAGAKVILQRTDIAWKVEMTTDAGGRFARGGIVPTSSESYKITITKEGYAPLTEQFAMPISSDPVHREFTLLLTSEAPAGAEAAAPDPAMKEDSEARAAFNEAIPLYNAKQFNEALPNLEKAYKSMADAVATMKDETAKAESKALLPTMAKAYGLALREVGKEDEAIAPLASVVDADPKNAKNADAMHALVEIYTKKGDEANRAKYQALLNAATGTTSAAAPYNEAVKAFNAGKFKEAKLRLEKAIAADPSFPDSYYLMGLVEMNQGNLAGAKSHFRKYLELAPNGKHAQEVKDALSAI